MEKLTQEFIENQFKNRGYLVLDVYIDNQTPILCEKNKYKAYISYANFSMGKDPSFFKLTNPFVKENMELYIKRMDSSVKVLNIERIIKGNKKRILLTLQCSCGDIYTKLWDDIYNKRKNRRIICNKCSLKIRGKNHRKDKQEFINKFNKEGYKILENIDNATRDKYIKVEDKNGYIGSISYNKILQNRKMAILDIRGNKENYILNLNHYCKLNGIKSKAVAFSDNQKWTRQGIQFVCECGNKFETSVASFQNGKIFCDVCSKRISRYEQIIKKFLHNNGISYIYQYYINSCRDILPLPFDFFINGKLLEVDGEGHYKPCNFNKCSDKDAILSFQSTQRHDKIKNDYCRKHKIPLLRVSYEDIKNNVYKQKIMQFIKE